jgi:hypothetical protein
MRRSLSSTRSSFAPQLVEALAEGGDALHAVQPCKLLGQRGAALETIERHQRRRVEQRSEALVEVVAGTATTRHSTELKAAGVDEQPLGLDAMRRQRRTRHALHLLLREHTPGKVGRAQQQAGGIGRQAAARAAVRERPARCRPARAACTAGR